MWKWTLGVALVVGLVAGATPALADTITLDLTIDWTSGLNSGTQSVGVVTYDDTLLTGIGTETITVAANSVTLDITVLHPSLTGWRQAVRYTTYSGVEDLPDDLPTLTVNHATQSYYISYESIIDGDDEGMYLFGNGAAWDFVWEVSYGTYTLAPRQSQNPVPEPASLALFGLGAVGLGVVRRRRRR